MSGPTMPAPRNEWERDMRSMLGKWVTVTLAREPKLVTQTGVLHGFSVEGDIMIADELFCMHWCWPNLDCQLSEDPRV